MAITGRAAALGFLGAVAVALAPVPGLVLLLVNFLIIVAVLVDVALAGSVRALEFSRSGPRAARLGQPVPLVLTVSNDGRRAVRARIRDGWPPSAGARPRVHSVTIPAGERRFLEETLAPSRRGDREPFRITVRSLGPLGLAGRQGRHQCPWRVRVLPPFHSRRHLPAALARLREIEGEVAIRGGGAGSEFDSLRDYVIGDDVRMIDWRSTARRGSVVLKTFRPERDRRVVCVLDTARTSAGRVGAVSPDAPHGPGSSAGPPAAVGDGPRLDHALDAALLLTAVALRAGDRVGLIAHDSEARLVMPDSTEANLLARMSEAMATLEPALVEADHEGLVSTVLRATRRRSLVVIFTELVPAVIEESLLPALPALTARHTVMVAALRDPRLAELAAGRGDVHAVYAAASAEQTLLRRRQLTEELRGRGVEVVDAPPDRYAPAVTDAYLTLKALGRL
ncbi:DUF58 domain-containing protein [Frankia sp. CNm7]|uniref:DUF58 domain-containing protein n=1 Tax=Frankia nepalensis TaxID=1836974 RepID=A0A937RKE6_9ACTN|nr:DUF58 domain-containing protein [Frankia nepalensis]MBL7496872.1 DUF58 domain-containing protein [Frankia nepalensis]MBL7512072.1 DUF58 domain-containing protein [Frankia nepalensis]MBL7524203.1 DUF58 domain-containing protein [Frankia nepalensis]MBL7630469.1 DUF58 domain-containing protein [Frankia nepalensis]